MTDPLHTDAVRALTAYVPGDPAQARLRRQFLAHLAAHPDGASRSGPPAHLTVGVLVIDPTGRRVLLTHHRKGDAWYQFGGHIEAADGTLRAAAARELTEESGLIGLAMTEAPVHLDRHALPGSFGRCREHLDVRYVAVAPADAVPVVSAESHDVRWFAVDDLPPGVAADLGGLLAARRHGSLAAAGAGSPAVGSPATAGVPAVAAVDQR